MSPRYRQRNIRKISQGQQKTPGEAWGRIASGWLSIRQSLCISAGYPQRYLLRKIFEVPPTPRVAVGVSYFLRTPGQSVLD